MGTNYTQYVVLGIEVKEKDCKTIISPPKYELQNRYDPRTGEVVRQENVLIKSEQYKYSFAGVEFDEFYDMEYVLRKNFSDPNIKFVYADSFYYIGYLLGESEGGGNIDLLKGNISVMEVLYLIQHSLDDAFKQIIPDKDERMEAIKLFFVPRVG